VATNDEHFCEIERARKWQVVRLRRLNVGISYDFEADWNNEVATRAIVMQLKTKRPVQFEITAVTREALQAWIKLAALKSDDFLFPSRLHDSPHLGTRQYARILGHWVDELGLDRSEYGTHSIRRTKATLIYRRTKNLRAVQLLLGHAKLESTVRYLGIEVDDALEISEQTEI
jgi:integrase